MNAQTPVKKVLVVDDESHIVHIVSLKLKNAGFHVVTAGDGEEALDVALAELPDFVITDYQMPFMSGIELCMKLAEDERTSHVPVLMLTARGFSLSPEDIAGTNILGVLSKPFSPREVLAKVQEILEKRAA